MQPVPEPAQLLQRSGELVLGAGELIPRSLAGGRSSAAAQGRRQLLEPSLGPIVQATLQPPTLLIPCRQDPPTRRCKLHDPGPHLGLEPSVGGCEPGGGGDRLQQPPVLQHRRVVDQDGDRLPLALHGGHRPPRTGTGEGEHAALGVDEHRPVGQPVADLEGRVAEGLREFAPECPGTSLAELDDQVGDYRPLPWGHQETGQESHRKDAQRHLVHEQRRAADLLRRQQQASRCGSGKHQAQTRGGLHRHQARPSEWADRPNIVAGADSHQQPGQQDGGAGAAPDRRDDRHRVADRDGSSDQSRPWPSGRVGEHQLHKGPAMQVHHVPGGPGHRRHTDLREVPQEPREAGRRHQRAGAALRSPP